MASKPIFGPLATGLILIIIHFRNFYVIYYSIPYLETLGKHLSTAESLSASVRLRFWQGEVMPPASSSHHSMEFHIILNAKAKRAIPAHFTVAKA